MKNQWTNYFKGTVKIKVTGKLIEPFLNHCMKEHITLWQIKRNGKNTVTFNILLDDVTYIRKIVKSYNCKIFFMQKHGLPFMKKRMLKNSGFLVGILSCLIIIFLLSNMVWNISVEGATPKTEHEIQKQLTEMGIKRGKFQFVLPNVNDIQMELMERIDMISWVGAELQGTTFNFQVVEKSKPDEKEMLSPRHLVAKKKGVIYDYFVEEGQPLIHINDYVNKGDILVSGIIGKEGNTKIVAAQGRVFAEVWYKSNVEIPMKTTFEVLSDRYKTKHLLHFGSVKVPVWGFGKPDFDNYKVESLEKPLFFLKWKLPITYEQETIREKEIVTRTYDEEAAKEIGMRTAINELRSKLSKESTIKGEKVLHETNDNGKVRLQIHFQVIEDIASKQPIIQGD
jgi:similar to stage IV sporulation protein